MLLINFFTDFALIRLLRVFSIMKGDNFVIGVSAIDPSTINLGKRVWSESLAELDSACGRFSFGGFLLGFWFCFVSIGIFAEFTDCAPHPLMKGNAQFALVNQGYTFSILTLRKWTSNLGSLGFHSQVYYTPQDKGET